MTAAATQATPAIPPRPSRGGSDKESSGSSAPKIPPRPVKTRIERSVSPNSQRFAQSPFNEGNFPRPNANKPALLSPNRGLYEPVEDPIDRPGSVTMPGVGEEGMEYSAIASEAEDDKDQNRAASPEQTRTVGEGLELHAPRPSLPANSAKARVEAVTRTDSDRAASFGIGRPTSAGGNGRPISRQSVGDRATSREGVKKRPSTSFSTSSDHGHHDDEDHGIPEIGQRVPMNRNLGDVQAPSPGPENKRNHARKHSSRGLPPGSYGLHGHGVGPQDKLEKAYYEKHPELLQREEHTPLHDRQNDFAMSKEDLNRLVRDTASRGAGFGTTPEYRGTPTEEVGFQASEEYVRQSSPRPGSAQPKDGHRRSSSLAKVVSRDDVQQEHEDGAIHVDDARHPEYRSYGDEEAAVDDEDHEYHAPILASDEVQKNPGAYLQRPAVHPPPERRTSNYEAEEGQSRPLSRPTSLHREHSQSKEHSQPEIRYTPLEDVEEYEPLFSEETKNERQPIEHADENKHHNHFPSKDIWEDAPSSVHYTATVSTPDLPESEHHRSRSSGHHDDRPMTPAHAFAKHQEELAEREAKRRSGGSFLPLGHEQKLNNMPKPTWAGHQAHLKVERPASGPKFPSRDVWEDVPESQLHEAIISSPEEEKKPEIPSRPAKKSSDSSERPAVPTRPKPRQTSGDDSRPKPPVSDKPKPQIPARPAKSSSGDSAAKAKPPVPSRPVGSSKIAALQSGFINDLNQRLKIGPQVHKEKPKEEEVQEEKEKAPLSDARKGRARGPQRRAPAAKSPAPAAAAEEKPSKPTLSFSLPQSSWQIDDEGNLAIDEKYDEQEKSPIAKEDPPTKEEPPVAVTENPSVEDAEEKQIEPEPAAEPALAPDGPAVNAESQIPAEEAKAESPEAPAESVPKDDSDNEGKVEKTLVANMAGESILEATVDKKEGGDTVNPVEVDDAVKP